jgi:hypothetical protein
LDTPRREQEPDDEPERPPGEGSAEGGNGQSGQQLEHTSGDEQSEKEPEEPAE